MKKRILTGARYLIIAVSSVCGFATGAIFGETVIAKSDAPTVLTFILAGQSDVTG